MPNQKKTVKVLVASPGDVKEERGMTEDVIKKWNAHPQRPLILEAVLWELSGAPETGERVQGILNKQIVDDCDFAIGIFWTRIGTNTGIAPGGAVEEVERLIKSGKQVMLYFSNVAFRERDVDRKQILQLKKFKKSIQKKALIEEYDERHEFKEKLTHQLDVQVYRWFCSTESPMLEVTLRTDSAFRLYEKIIKEDLALSVCWACQVLRV